MVWSSRRTTVCKLLTGQGAHSDSFPAEVDSGAMREGGSDKQDQESKVLTWCPTSPDLNPIKCLWTNMLILSGRHLSAWAAHNKMLKLFWPEEDLCFIMQLLYYYILIFTQAKQLKQKIKLQLSHHHCLFYISNSTLFSSSFLFLSLFSVFPGWSSSWHSIHVSGAWRKQRPLEAV